MDSGAGGNSRQAAAAAGKHSNTRACQHCAGEGRAWLVPLALDGFVVKASMTMMVRRPAGKDAGWPAWMNPGAGIAASLVANVAAAESTLIGMAVAAWPPGALLLAYELVMDQIRIAGKTSPPSRPCRVPQCTATCR
jgi:hypothetical protein